MQKSSEQTETSDHGVPLLDLPVLSEIARRSPVLTMDQYFALNEAEDFDSCKIPVVLPHERCAVPFEL